MSDHAWTRGPRRRRAGRVVAVAATVAMGLVGPAAVSATAVAGGVQVALITSVGVPK